MGVPQPIQLRAEDLWETPEDGNRYEIIGGRLYMAPPPVERHQRAVSMIDRHVGGWSEARALGRLYVAPCGVVLDDGTGVQPDAFFIARDRIADIVREKGIYGAPDLVVEVLSPSTERRDRIVKLEAYAAAGVREYWLVDPGVRAITVLALSGGTFEKLATVSGDQTIPSRVLPGLPVTAEQIFAE